MIEQKAENVYKLQITAYEAPSILGSDAYTDNNEQSARLFLDGGAEDIAKAIASGLWDDVKAVGTEVGNIGSDAFNEGLSKALKDVSDDFEKGIGKLAAYTDGFSKGKYLDAFTLPVPQTLIDSLKHTYDQDTFNPLELMRKLGSKIAKKAMRGEGANRIADATLDFNIAQAKRNNFVFDNNLINTYKQTEQRDFTFNFTFIPNDYDHFKEILEMYARIKVLMTGKKIASNFGMQQSAIFTVTFGNPWFEAYMVLDESVELNLVSLEIDVSGNPFTAFEETNAKTGNGVPKVINIIMNFIERRPLRQYDHSKKEAPTDVTPKKDVLLQVVPTPQNNV